MKSSQLLASPDTGDADLYLLEAAAWRLDGPCDLI